MPKIYLPPQSYLVQCFDYDPATGVFLWRRRPDHHFPRPSVAQMWNTQNAGNEAFMQITDGYRRSDLRCEGQRVRMRACRAAWKIIHGTEPEQIDHIDGNRANDALANLRPATQQQNQRNRAGWGGRDLPKGVYLDRGAIRAAIWLDGRSVKLGRFATPIEAHEAYCAAAREHHGEFFNPGNGMDTLS